MKNRGGHFAPVKVVNLNWNGVVTLSGFSNQEAERIREHITNKKAHKLKDTHQITGGFINFIIESITEGKYYLSGFDLNQIELLVRTLDHFFKTLETSKMKLKDNDWFDFAILAYVQPGDKYWTNDGKWLRLIKGAGCEEYLLEV